MRAGRRRGRRGRGDRRPLLLERRQAGQVCARPERVEAAHLVGLDERGRRVIMLIVVRFTDRARARLALLRAG